MKTRGRRQRREFTPGMQLRARDLRDGDDYESWLRGMHTRLVHDTWGIVAGFEVGTSAASDAVIVSAGLAIDRCGREIVLPHERRLAINLSGVRWLDLAVRATCLADAPSCLPVVPAARGTAAFRWHVAARGWVAPPPLAPGLRLGDEVPLARIRVQGSLGAPDLAIARYARSMRRPPVAGDTREVTWAAAGVCTWQCHVDTHAMRFDAAPLVFVSAENLMSDVQVLGPLLQVSNVSAVGFDVSCRFATGAPQNVRPPQRLTWTAVHMACGCPPEPLIIDITIPDFDIDIPDLGVFP